jgi:hypothetical protein
VESNSATKGGEIHGPKEEESKEIVILEVTKNVRMGTR